MPSIGSSEMRETVNWPEGGLGLDDEDRLDELLREEPEEKELELDVAAGVPPEDRLDALLAELTAGRLDELLEDRRPAEDDEAIAGEDELEAAWAGPVEDELDGSGPREVDELELA